MSTFPHRVKLFLSLILLLGSIGLHAALPPAERLLPADTLGFITIPDWSLTRSNFNGSSLGQFFNDPAMKPLKEKFLDNFLSDKISPVEKQLGIKLADYGDLVRGQATLALTRNNWTGSLDKKPGMLWLVDTRDKAEQARTNIIDLRKRWVDKGNKMRIDKVRDAEFTTFIIPPGEPPPPPPPGREAEAKPSGPSELSIGLAGTLLLMGDSTRDIEKVLALQAGSSVPALADQASFAANAPMLRDANLFAWVDVKSIVAAILKQAREDQPAEKPPSLFGAPPTFDKVLRALGLADVQTIAANATTARDGSVVNLAISVPESSRRGVFKMLAVDQKDSSPPPFVPADAVKFNRWRIDLQKAWSSLEAMMNDISPASGGVIKLLLDTAGKDKDPNFDLRKLLLANLGDDVITYDKAPRAGDDPSKAPSLVLIGTKNADQMSSALGAITGIIPPNIAKYQEREFLGRKLCSFTMPSLSDGKATAINYAASSGYLAISSDASLVEEFLRSSEGKAKSLRDTPGLADAAQKVGGMNTGFFSYENQGESLRTAFEVAKKNPAEAVSIPGSKLLTGATSGNKENAVTNWFDPALLPSYDRVSKYFSMAVSALNVSPAAITFKMFTPTPPALRAAQ